MKINDGMRKYIFILMLSSLYCSGGFSQVAYYDARNLAELFKSENNKEKIGGILGNYLPKGRDSVSLSGIRLLYLRNPFFKSLAIIDTGYFKWLLQQESVKIAQSRSAFFSSISSIDVTKYANALASLMIDRAKQELTISFFNRFKKFVEKNPEAGILFPKTTDNLSNLLTYKYPEMLPALRVSFFEDISKIAYTLDDVLALPRYEQLLANVPEVSIVLRSLRLAQEITSGATHPADAFTDFAAFPEWKDSSLINWGSSVKLANIFSQSLRKTDAVSIVNDSIRYQFNSTQPWVSPKEIKELIKDTVAFKIYLGLIYQLAAKEKIFWKMGKETIQFTVMMAKYKDHPIVFENKISGFIALAERTNNAYKGIIQKKDSSISLTKDDYYNYVNTSLDIIEYGLGIARSFNDSFSLPQYDYVKTLRKINNLYRHTYKEEYTQVVNDAVGILTDIEEKTKWRQGDSGRSYKKLSLVIPQIAKYGTFMANVADAKTPEDVKGALDNAILPVGSSAIKKYARFNVSIQSYLGAFLRFGKKDMAAGYAWTDRWGISAPIGISISHGFSKWGSLSVFASLIDLGAIVDYQLKVDSVINSSGDKVPAISKDYKIELGQLFSPGGYLVYGFGGNIPLAFGVGAQYGPGLSKIDIDAGIPVVLNPKWRFNAFLSVDLPFFNLINSTHTRR